MDREKVVQWLKALRSEDYSQTKSHLRDEKGYCCLGVACEVVFETGWVEVYDPMEGQDIFETSEGKRLDLTKYQAKVLGLDAATPQWLRDEIAERVHLSEDHSETDSLEAFCMTLNDEGFTFDQIADCMERVLLREGALI